MVGLPVNIDVPDVAAGIAFCTAALPRRVGRRFDDDFVALLGAAAPLYLLKAGTGSAIAPSGGGARGTTAFADPFGHGFCLLQFHERGYDALL